jgi:RNA recognition motif-containing protein
VFWAITGDTTGVRLFLFIARKIVGWNFQRWFETRFSGTALWLAFVLITKFMKLYVGNLSFSTTDPDLKDLFAQYGTVTDVHLVTDRMTGKSRGFAFVTMSSAAEGKAAIAALEGKNLDGRNLTVNEARPKDEGAKRSFSKSRW